MLFRPRLGCVWHDRLGGLIRRIGRGRLDTLGGLLRRIGRPSRCDEGGEVPACLWRTSPDRYANQPVFDSGHPYCDGLGGASARFAATDRETVAFAVYRDELGGAVQQSIATDREAHTRPITAVRLAIPPFSPSASLWLAGTAHSRREAGISMRQAR